MFNLFKKKSVIENEYGKFVLDKFGFAFDCKVEINGIMVNVALFLDEENSNSAIKANEAFLRFMKFFEGNYYKYHEIAADKLLNTLNEWIQDVEPGRVILKEEFIHNIELYIINVDNDGTVSLTYEIDESISEHPFEIELDNNFEVVNIDLLDL